MIIASWNVNSVKARLGHAEKWLKDTHVDVLLLQELKGEEAGFPADAFKALGFEHQVVLGQKSYNGVAMLSRAPITETQRGLPGDDADEQARFVGGCVNGVYIYNLYLPNGNPSPGPKFDYKLAWLKRLHTFMAATLAREVPAVFAGDYNVIPTAGKRDVFNAAAWEGDALFSREAQRAYAEICSLGYADIIAAHHAREPVYTFWDYRAGCWERNDGIRIDHLLLTPEATDRAQNAWVDSTPRGWDTPSDHTPVLVNLT